jgi:hypothetical protein
MRGHDGGKGWARGGAISLKYAALFERRIPLAGGLSRLGGLQEGEYLPPSRLRHCCTMGRQHTTSKSKHRSEANWRDHGIFVGRRVRIMTGGECDDEDGLTSEETALEAHKIGSCAILAPWRIWTQINEPTVDRGGRQRAPPLGVEIDRSAVNAGQVYSPS